MKKTHILTHLSLLLAISTLLSFLGFIVPIAGISGMKITFSFLPIMLAGIIFGPVAGAMVGALSDILGYLIKFHMYGPWFPGFTVTLALSGAMPALILNMFKNNEDKYRYLRLGIAVIITSITVTVINTYWLQLLYGQAFMVILPMRIIKEIIFIPFQIVSLGVVTNLYTNLIKQYSSYNIKY